jgi:hypothetical protein
MKVLCKSFGGDRRQWQTRLEFPSPLLVRGHYPQVGRLSTGAVLSAGEDRCIAVPKGRLRPACAAERSGAADRSDPTPHPSAVPSGLLCLAECFPALKRRAILKMSLRDKGMEA